MLAEKNLPTLKQMLPYCQKNISCSRIVIIASPKLKPEIEKISGVIFANEDEIVPGLTLNNVFDIIEHITGKRERAGWYFQQFLKFAWAYQCKDKNYIVMDSDTFPLNPIPFIEDGKYLFTGKTEYHKPYFKTINRLFAGKIQRIDPVISFIAEHMIFDCAIVKEIIEKIQNNPSLTGNSWWKKILYTIELEDVIHSGFSEFETYGNYLFTLYPELGKVRKLRTLRQGAYFLGSTPTSEQLSWAANDYDIVSIESWGGVDKFLQSLTKSKAFRSIISLRKLVLVWALTYRPIRTCYRKFISIFSKSKH